MTLTERGAQVREAILAAITVTVRESQCLWTIASPLTLTGVGAQVREAILSGITLAVRGA